MDQILNDLQGIELFKYMDDNNVRKFINPIYIYRNIYLS